MKNLKKTIATTASIAALSALLACGSGSNNDQGVSFSALYWANASEGACTEAPISGATAPISLGNTGEVLGGSLQAVSQCIVLENRMISQFVRTDRIYYTFSIPGATVQPPTTSLPLSVFLAQVAAAETDAEGGTTTTTENVTKISAGALIVPPQIFEWISLNRESLPSIPFQLEVFARVSGVTASGDRLETNEVGIPVIITEDQIIAPSPGPVDEVPTPVDETGDSTGTSTETSL